ncbi:MAG: hypothetical protein UH241_08770 [Acutalibacteraceae bacterium]|nr:hypothetical protein [Acutalibacteraceae bacterium]
MAKVIAKLLTKAAKAIGKWGAKNWNKIVNWAKNHWKTVLKWIGEMAIWEVIEYIAELLGF